MFRCMEPSTAHWEAALVQSFVSRLQSTPMLRLALYVLFYRASLVDILAASKVEFRLVTHRRNSCRIFDAPSICVFDFRSTDRITLTSMS